MQNMSENGVPESLKEEFGAVKIGVAVAFLALIFGLVLGVATGKIPETSQLGKEAVTLFVAIIGAAAGFVFGRHFKGNGSGAVASKKG